MFAFAHLDIRKIKELVQRSVDEQNVVEFFMSQYDDFFDLRPNATSPELILDPLDCTLGYLDALLLARIHFESDGEIKRKYVREYRKLKRMINLYKDLQNAADTA